MIFLAWAVCTGLACLFAIHCGKRIEKKLDLCGACHAHLVKEQL